MMTTAELIADLTARLDRGIAGMERMACDVDCAPQTHSLNESLRLRSKAQGLRIAKDWLRSYPNEEKTS